MNPVIKIGGYAMLAGLAAVFLVFLGDFGPCGPGTRSGHLLMSGGFLSIGVGWFIAVGGFIGLAVKGIHRKNHLT